MTIPYWQYGLNIANLVSNITKNTVESKPCIILIFCTGFHKNCGLRSKGRKAKGGVLGKRKIKKIKNQKTEHFKAEI
jgi:hypothetical protein